MELNPWLISFVVFVGVTAVVGAVASMFREKADEDTDKRLDMFTGMGSGADSKSGRTNILSASLEDQEGMFAAMVVKISRLRLIFEQADTTVTPSQIFSLTTLLAAAGWAVAFVYAPKWWLAPLAGLALAGLPFLWLLFKRSRRFKAFAGQLPDALELISRALRAGHSLAAGLDLVRQEMQDPIAKEFGRVFDEQNLGLPLDDALRGMVDRIPNLDLKFFVTAVALQRQTGGDLAEILDKIGHLVRERFKIHGQVQALTGEGRLSGVVLLGLPPVLFLAVWRLNPDYVKVLFTDELGTKMLVGALFLQLVGALVIRKIVNIKV